MKKNETVTYQQISIFDLDEMTESNHKCDVCNNILTESHCIITFDGLITCDLECYNQSSEDVEAFIVGTNDIDEFLTDTLNIKR